MDETELNIDKILIKEEDEEVKKKKRKQSNREAARRSRLRKQEECQKLQGTVEDLKAQSSMLKNELLSLSEECRRLKDKNDSIMEELRQTYGPEAVSSIIPSTVNLEKSESPSSKQTTPKQGKLVA